MRKGVATGALIVLGGLAAAWAYRDALSFAYLRHRIRPSAPFAAAQVPSPPDYADPAHWAALPDREDAADEAPPGAAPDAQATARADVFFVHPTTYYRSRSWNQPLDDADVNRFTDQVVVRGGASAFNACCRVYAPRYRQATLYAMPIFDPGGDGARAIEVAYRDVEAAFDHYLAHHNRGRPFFLAAHSQGSLHARRLLERRISGSSAAERLVAAYLIGYGVGHGVLAESVPDVPVCDAPDALRCFVTWNAVAPGAAAFEDTSDHVCVNPLTWRADGARAGHAANLGAVFFPAPELSDADLSRAEAAVLGVLGLLRGLLGSSDEERSRPGRVVVEPEAADAQCVDGRLVVREIRSRVFRPSPVWGDNYHAYDYPFFYMNLRQNASLRLARHLAGAAPDE